MIPLEVVDAVGSTSDVLKRRVEAGFAGEAALMARRQTGGRGRLGRVWESPAGNLYCSVLLRPGQLRWPGHWSLLAAVALTEAVGREVRLKWPNDLLLDGGKLAGILLECGFEPRPWLVIGMGVNLQVAPAGLGRAVAALGPGAPAPEAFAATLLPRLDAWRRRYEREGFGPVRAAWLSLGHRMGEPLVAGGRAGRFAGLSETGALLLETEGEVIAISSGEVG